MIRAFTSRRCLAHRSPPGMPEVEERLETVLDGLHAARVEVEQVDAHPALDEVLAEIHDERYLARLQRAVERGDGFIDSADNPLSPGTWEAARAAAEATLAAADWVAAGTGRRALAAVRPPGHHAERAMAMGFCYLNNVALAAQHLVRAGCRRLAIFDFDVHHGNGTQHLFEERSDVLFVSTHQFPFYPGTGAAGETGRGAGEGFTLNLPLPAGTGDEGYAAAIRDRVLPALAHHRPEVLLISAGFDAWRGDPLGGMAVSEDGYGDWSRRLGELADEICSGRVLAVLEGGYDLAALGRLATLHLTGLDGGPGAPAAGGRSAD